MLVSHICHVCKYHWRLPPLFYPTRLPEVIAFFDDHGVPFDLAPYEQRTRLIEFEEELLTRPPLFSNRNSISRRTVGGHLQRSNGRHGYYSPLAS